MSTLAANNATLLDVAKRLDPSGKVPTIVELLSQSNEVLTDMQWYEGNLPTGHRTTVRTGLPTAAWRLLNQGVQPSKSTTAQIDEACAILEAWSEVDEALAQLNGNTEEFRMSEAQAFIEAMNQEMASTLFYGNASVSPEEFTGLSTRYSDVNASIGQNILDAGSSDTDNTSIWLIVWGQNTVHGIFPKGSKAGLQHDNLGLQTIETAGGSASGTRMRAYQDRWQWRCGIALRDWRFAVRIGSIDVSNLVTKTNAADLIELMIKAIHRIPQLSAGRPVFYMNRTVFQMLDIQRRDDVITGGGINYETVDGKITPTFRGIPIRKVDALLENETAI